MVKRGPYQPRVARSAAVSPEPNADPRQEAIEQVQRGLWAAERAKKIQVARGDTVEAFQAFIELCMPDPEAPDDPNRSLFSCRPHHRVLMEMVARIGRRESLRAACSMPPQHGKSLLLAKFGIAWIIGRAPHLRVLFATYNQKLAETRGAELREVLTCSAFRAVFPKAQLVRGGQSKDEMRMVAGGAVNLAGRGSGTTGRPCDLFVIDDPYADQQEARSAATLREVKEWYSSVVFTRCPITTPILIVHTRWNEDDLLGWLTDPEHQANKDDPTRIYREDGSAKWQYVNLPAIVRDPSLAKAMGMEVGSALCPERFPVEHLMEAKRNDPRIYSALYEGKPSPEEGDFFKAEDFVTYRQSDMPPWDQLRFYAASDHAVSEKQDRDSTVAVVVGVDKNDFVYVMPDIYWARSKTDKSVEAMIDLMDRYQPLWWRAASDHISKSIGPFLRKRMLERKTFCNIVESSEKGDKIQKAQSFQARMAMKRILFPAGATWLMDARSQLLKFPHGAHDDFVDAMAHACRGLRVMWGARAAPQNDNANDSEPKVGTLGWISWAAKREKRDGLLSLVANGR